MLCQRFSANRLRLWFETWQICFKQLDLRSVLTEIRKKFINTRNFTWRICIIKFHICSHKYLVPEPQEIIQKIFESIQNAENYLINNLWKFQGNWSITTENIFDTANLVIFGQSAKILGPSCLFFNFEYIFYSLSWNDSIIHKKYWSVVII